MNWAPVEQIAMGRSETSCDGLTHADACIVHDKALSNAASCIGYYRVVLSALSLANRQGFEPGLHGVDGLARRCRRLTRL